MLFGRKFSPKNILSKTEKGRERSWESGGGVVFNKTAIQEIFIYLPGFRR